MIQKKNQITKITGININEIQLIISYWHRKSSTRIVDDLLNLMTKFIIPISPWKDKTDYSLICKVGCLLPDGRIASADVHLAKLYRIFIIIDNVWQKDVGEKYLWINTPSHCLFPPDMCDIWKKSKPIPFWKSKNYKKYKRECMIDISSDSD